jgi:hypothetical protein
MVFSTFCRGASGSSCPIFINSSHCMKEKLVTLQGVLIYCYNLQKSKAASKLIKFKP